ncbi:MAG TPA: SPOR domain-containing protein [Bacteroidia bacterium]|nr:SPOR domain-containing protein [Bacteroidia bacterium]
MIIAKNISELLYEHDCVIVPDFGGFVCNYSPAYIHSGKTQFHAPFKKISFNKNLRNNDGLLANKISQKENISYSEANKIISSEVVKLQYELEHNNRIEFKNIGVLYYGEESTLLFDQDESVNYLPESFGFHTFYSPVIKRQSLERKVEKHLKDRVVALPLIQEGKNKSKRVGLRYVGIAASVLLCGSLLLFSIKNNMLNNRSIANLNPFAKGSALYQPESDAIPALINESTGSLLAFSNKPSDTTRYLNILINGSIPIVVSLEQDKTQVEKIIKNKSKGTFHVIAGAFSMVENAEKLVAKLKKLGYNASIIDKKLHMVSYGSFPSRKDALEAMDRIRSTQQDVWLMTN